MERKFIPTLRTGNGYTYLKVQGVIDEDNLLTRLTGQIQGNLLLLDLSEVERINSCGVRDWVNWLGQFSAMGVFVVMMRCSPAVINQVNMVTNFSAGAVVHSFFAPYVNPDTDEEKSILLYTRDLKDQWPLRAPQVRDEMTGVALEFDEFEESYFAFMSGLRGRDLGLSAEMEQLIAQFTPEHARMAAARQAPVSPPPPGAASMSFAAPNAVGGGLQRPAAPQRPQPMAAYPADLEDPTPRSSAPARVMPPAQQEATRQSPSMGRWEQASLPSPVAVRPSAPTPPSSAWSTAGSAVQALPGARPGGSPASDPAQMSGSVQNLPSSAYMMASSSQASAFMSSGGQNAVRSRTLLILIIGMTLLFLLMVALFAWLLFG